MGCFIMDREGFRDFYCFLKLVQDQNIVQDGPKHQSL